MMKQKAILIIALLALVSMMIAPVCAETLTGTLGGSGINTSAYYIEASGTGGGSLTSIFVNDIEYSAGTTALIRWDCLPTNNAYMVTYSGTKLSGNQTTFIGNISAVTVATGWIGYSRVFDWLGNPICGGYQWVQFNTYNITGYTGDQTITLTYGYLDGMGPAPGGTARSSDPPRGRMAFYHAGDYIDNIAISFQNSYTATKPSGLGISGSIIKSVGGVVYPSKGYVFNASNLSQILSSDFTVNNYPFNFTTNVESIKLGVEDSLGNLFYSPILFTAAGPTPTPTVTPTPAPTIPAGYVRNNLYVWDQNDAQISGADVDVRDVENGSWTNTTADADGWITIDTLPYHTVNVYAHYPTAGIYLPNEILGLETGYYGGHNWVLVLYPYVSTPSGFVTLYINTRNYDTKAVLTGVGIQLKNLVTGAITGESTGSTDSVSTVVTNATNYQITGSKSGYISKTIIINSGEALSKTVVLELSKATVTPAITSTIPPGGVTPVVTLDPAGAPGDAGYSNAKGQEIMDYLASHGMELVSICFVVTILGLLKMVSKK